MASPPTLPADLSRRAEPPSKPGQRSRDADGDQLSTLLTTTQRLEHTSQQSAAGLQELRWELQTLREHLKDRDQTIRDFSLLTQPSTVPPVRSSPSRVGAAAAVFAAVTSLGALGGAAVLIREQRQQQTSLAAVAADTHSLGQAVAQLGESVVAQSLAAANAAHALAPAKPGSISAGGNKPPGAQVGDGQPSACPPAPEGAAAGKPRVLLPNLVGLRLAEARTTVAPLQLQLLPTDKKLEEVSRIGWQLPNPGAELEPDEAVTVALRPPVQKKRQSPR